MTKRLECSGVVLAGHKEAAIELRGDAVDAWGSPLQSIRPGRRGIAVRVRLGSIEFDSHVVSRQKRWFLLLPDSVLQDAGVAPGTTVSVRVTPSAPAATLQ